MRQGGYIPTAMVRLNRLSSVFARPSIHWGPKGTHSRNGRRWLPAATPIPSAGALPSIGNSPRSCNRSSHRQNAIASYQETLSTGQLSIGRYCSPGLVSCFNPLPPTLVRYPSDRRRMPCTGDRSPDTSRCGTALTSKVPASPSRVTVPAGTSHQMMSGTPSAQPDTGPRIADLIEPVADLGTPILRGLRPLQFLQQPLGLGTEKGLRRLGQGLARHAEPRERLECRHLAARAARDGLRRRRRAAHSAAAASA